jgi:hypothetical protein
MFAVGSSWHRWMIKGTTFGPRISVYGELQRDKINKGDHVRVSIPAILLSATNAAILFPTGVHSASRMTRDAV